MQVNYIIASSTEYKCGLGVNWKGKGDTSTISAVHRMHENPGPSAARDVLNSHVCLDMRIFSF